MGEILEKSIKENNFIVSGGTDFHSVKISEREIGARGLTLEEFEALKKYKDSRFN